MDKNQYFYEIYKIANTQRELAEKQKELKTSCKQRLATGAAVTSLTIVSVVAGILSWSIATVAAVMLFVLGGVTGIASVISFICAGIENKEANQIKNQREELANKKEELIREMGNLDNPILTQLKIVPAHVHKPGKKAQINKEDQEPQL